jgi:osmotically-inducible protein OsmY
VANTQARLRPQEAVSDAVLTQRVRTELGQVCSHPRAIMVTTEHGRVTLRGLILAREEETVLRAVAAVRGVATVENQLVVPEKVDFG